MDSLLYVSEVRQGDIITNPSRINRISPLDGTVVSFFDAPENGITELSIGTDGQLHAIDGFDGPSARRTKLHTFDPVDGTLISTALARQIMVGDLKIDEFAATSVIQALSDGTFILDASGNLWQTAVVNQELVPLGMIQGLPSSFGRGNAMVGDRLFFAAQDRVRNEFFDRIYEIYLVPEPSNLSLCIAAIVLTIVIEYCRRGFRCYAEFEQGE
jgi:hypothetical protein